MTNNVKEYRNALAKELKVSENDIEYIGTCGYTDYGLEFQVGNEVYDVFSGDDADKEFLECIKELAYEAGWCFGSEFPIENYIDSDYFDDEMEEHARIYAEDIESEDGNEPYANRLIEEAADMGVVDDDDLIENSDGLLDFADENARDSIMEEFIQGYMDEYDNSVEYIVDSYGEDYIEENCKSAINFKELAEDIINSYTRGHEIASYDGYELELGNDLFAYRRE